MLLWALWLAGRLVMSVSWVSPLVLAVIDASFLIVVAGIAWREIIAAQAWERLPMGVLISLYAFANVLFHKLWMTHAAVDLAVRLGLILIMMLLAMIGGKITPGFTEDFLNEEGIPKQPAVFSPLDGFAILLLGVAGVAWLNAPEESGVGYLFVAVGMLHLYRLSRWYGWLTWRNPLVWILHVGYGWLAMSFLILGGAILGIGVYPEDAVHALTTGAVGVMTLAVMTRASLGHTGRAKRAGPLTVTIFLLVNLGALLRVFGPSLHISDTTMLVWAGLCWSGAYLLFVMGYGPILFWPSLEEDS